MNLEENLKKAEEPEETPEHRPRYTIRNAAFIMQERPPVEEIVKGLISVASVNIFFGESGAKKTYILAGSLATCVSLGKPWLGFETKKSKVLIIDEESGEERLSRRLKKSIKGELGDDTTEIEFVSFAAFKLDNPQDVAEIEELILKTQAQFVIIDALADVMDGDENSKKDTQPVLIAAKRIAEHTRAAIVIIHHTNKSGGYRGSSAIKGAVDLMVLVESEPESKWINFRSEKNRDGEPMKWAAVAAFTDDQFYLTAAEPKLRTKRPDSELFVLKYLSKHGESTIEALCEMADTCSPAAAKKAIYRLAAEKLTARTDAGSRGAKAVYQLTALGEQLVHDLYQQEEL